MVVPLRSKLLRYSSTTIWLNSLLQTQTGNTRISSQSDSRKWRGEKHTHTSSRGVEPHLTSWSRLGCTDVWPDAWPPGGQASCRLARRHRRHPAPDVLPWQPAGTAAPGGSSPGVPCRDTHTHYYRAFNLGFHWAPGPGSCPELLQVVRISYHPACSGMTSDGFFENFDSRIFLFLFLRTVIFKWMEFSNVFTHCVPQVMNDRSFDLLQVGSSSKPDLMTWIKVKKQPDVRSSEKCVCTHVAVTSNILTASIAEVQTGTTSNWKQHSVFSNVSKTSSVQCQPLAS